MVKTEYVLGLIERVERTASAAQPFNQLKASLDPLKKRMLSKKALGLNPDETKAVDQIAAAKAAVDAYNEAVVITLPDDADILAGLSAAESDTPTELEV